MVLAMVFFAAESSDTDAFLVIGGVVLVALTPGLLILYVSAKRKPDLRKLGAASGLRFMDASLPSDFPFGELFRFDLSEITIRNVIYGGRAGAEQIAFDIETGSGYGRNLITVAAIKSHRTGAPRDLPDGMLYREGCGWRVVTRERSRVRTSKMSVRQIKDAWEYLLRRWEG